MPAYWSPWSALTVVELVLYFLLDQSTFTLMVAGKTFLMMIYWVYVSDPHGSAPARQRRRRRQAGYLDDSSTSDAGDLSDSSDEPDSPELDFSSMSRKEKVERIGQYERHLIISGDRTEGGFSSLADKDDAFIDKYLKELKAARQQKRHQDNAYVREELRRARERPEGDATDPARRKARALADSKIPADRQARLEALRQQGHLDSVDLEDQVAHLQKTGQYEAAERQWERLVPPKPIEETFDSSDSGTDGQTSPRSRKTRERMTARRSAASSGSDADSDVKDQQVRQPPSREKAKRERRRERKTEREPQAPQTVQDGDNLDDFVKPEPGAPVRTFHHAPSDEEDGDDSEAALVASERSSKSKRSVQNRRRRKQLELPTLEGDPDADKRLRKLGYRDVRARYMMLNYQLNSKPDRVKSHWDTWDDSDPESVKHRERKYIEKYKEFKVGAHTSDSSAPESATSDVSQASRFSRASRASRASSSAAVEPARNPGELEDDEIDVLLEHYAILLDEPGNDLEQQLVSDKALESQIDRDLPGEIRKSRFEALTKKRRRVIMDRFKRDLKSGNDWEFHLDHMAEAGFDLRRIYDPTLRRLRVKYGWSSALANAAQRLFEDKKEGGAPLRREVREALTDAETRQNRRALERVAAKIDSKMKDIDMGGWRSKR